MAAIVGQGEVPRDKPQRIASRRPRRAAPTRQPQRLPRRDGPGRRPLHQHSRRFRVGPVRARDGAGPVRGGRRDAEQVGGGAGPECGRR